MQLLYLDVFIFVCGGWFGFKMMNTLVLVNFCTEFCGMNVRIGFNDRLGFKLMNRELCV